MHGAGFEQLLLLRRGARQRDGRGAGIVGDLDSGEADAARRRRDEDKVALRHLCILDERPISGREHHPHRGGLDERKRLRLPYDRVVGNENDLAIGRIVVHREGWDNVDIVANSYAADILPHRVDDAGGLVTETRRKLDGLDVVVDPPHGFGAVDADRLDLDADLLWTRSCNLGVYEFEDFRSSGYCELDRA